MNGHTEKALSFKNLGTDANCRRRHPRRRRRASLAPKRKYQREREGEGERERERERKKERKKERKRERREKTCLRVQGGGILKDCRHTFGPTTFGLATYSHQLHVLR